MRRGIQILPQQLQPARRHGGGVPGRFTEEPLQPLHGGVLRPDDGLGMGQRRQGLVAFGRQQQSSQVLAKGRALIGPGQQGIELGGIPLERLRDRRKLGGNGVMVAPPPARSTT